jgi:crotonobetainyl-CoA:carnitine CoA-transferase CaiB-like acyl-CoA transferase
MATGVVPGPMGSGVPAIAPYEAFPTSDGHVMVSAGNDALFARLCTALGCEELVGDPRFLTNPRRSANHDELIPLIAAKTSALTTQHFLELGRKHAVPLSAIHDVAQVLADPQVQASEMFVSAPNPEVADYKDLSMPVRMEGERPRGTGSPPRSGEHTRDILSELGYGDGEIGGLLDSGVVEAF